MRSCIHFPADSGSPVTLVLGARLARVEVLEALTVQVVGTDLDVRSRGVGTVNHRAFGVLSEMAGPVPDMRGDVIFFVHKGQLGQAKQIIKGASKINPWTGWDWVVLRDSPPFMEALDELTSRLAPVDEPDHLVQLLEAHQRVFGYRDGALHCACGWVSSGAEGHQDTNAVNQLSGFAELRHHVAAMIREALGLR